MADNMIESALKILETVIAPSIGDLKAHAITTDKNFESVDKQFKTATEHADVRFLALNDRLDYQYKSMMSELHAIRAQIEANNVKLYSELRERVAVIESQLRMKQ